YVRLPTVMMKLLSDNGNQDFGDFKATILGMLGTSLIEDDTYYMMKLLKIKEELLMGMAREIFFVVYETSRRSLSTGCPICMTKKKGARSKGKSTSVENGLVSKSLQKHKLPQGTGAIHVHENDALDRQLSRLRLAPPAVYHEKVKKGVAMLRGRK
ncbi:hypothetical protein Tco_1424553, partial [Tanacetum coccineum]